MKRFFEYIGLVAIILVSFYYTNKVALLIQSNNPLMQSIKEAATKIGVQYVNAEITDNYIVPGLNGLEVNIEKSFTGMKSVGVFNEHHLIFNETKPEISLASNKDKIITGGNKNKNAVAFIINNNENVKNYFLVHNIPAALMTNINSYRNENFELLNGEVTKDGFSNMESLLNKDKKNVHICLINDRNKDICLKNKKYLVKESMTLTLNNLINIRTNINSGAIILITGNAKTEDVNVLIRQIRFQGLKILPLSKLISEKAK